MPCQVNECPRSCISRIRRSLLANTVELRDSASTREPLQAGQSWLCSAQLYHEIDCFEQMPHNRIAMLWTASPRTDGSCASHVSTTAPRDRRLHGMVRLIGSRVVYFSDRRGGSHHRASWACSVSGQRMVSWKGWRGELGICPEGTTYRIVPLDV